MAARVVVGTRVWGAFTPYMEEVLRSFIDHALSSDVGLVVVAHDGVLNNTAESVPVGVELLEVLPWGFSSALNALISRAFNGEEAEAILVASAEISLTREIVDPLVSLVLEPGVLVAGAALPGHNYVPGWSGLSNGTQVPWNTLAAWGPALFPFGFPPVSDLKGSAGVEEWAAIWFAQKVLGVENAQAFLLGIPGISWDTDFGGDEKRKEAHRKKMASKISRPQSQMDYILALMGLRGRSAPWMAPWVSHL